MYKKKRFWIILVSAVLAICFLPLPSRINKNMTGTGFYPKGHELESVVTEETIQIKGWYLRFLLWDNRFWGDIHVVSEDPEHDCILVDNPEGVHFFEHLNHSNWGMLAYYDVRTYDGYFANIVEKGSFDEVLYFSHALTDRYMAFPAIGREDAVALVNKLFIPVE